MPNTRFNFKSHSHIRIFTSLLIFALASPQLGYAQQPQTPQPRILTQEDQKASAAKPSGPRDARPELVLQTGVTVPAYNAIFSPDGRTLAINNESETGGARRDLLTLLDSASGRVIQTIKISERKMTMMMGHTSEPSRAIRFSPDGRAVAVSFNDMKKDMSQFISGGQIRAFDRENKIRMWDVSSGREMLSFDAGSLSAGTYDPSVSSGARDAFALSNDNRQCAVTGGNTIKLFDPAAGRNLATIIGHTGAVIGVNFSADGKLLATTSLDSTIKIWNVSAAAITGRVELARTLSGMALPVESAAFGEDGRALAVSGSNTVSVWELNTGAALRSITRPAVTRDLDDLIHPAPSVFSAGARNTLTAEAVRTILSHGVSDLELEAALEGVDAGRLLFVLDACNSGQALEAEEKRRGPMNSSGLAQLAYEKGMYILTAAQSYQAALEAAELGHGYLTFALIEDGLKKGLADRDPKDGLALAREWFNYVEERVPQMQEREMQTRLLLDFAGDDAKAKNPQQRGIQRPRVFYRRELEARPFVVAKP